MEKLSGKRQTGSAGSASTGGHRQRPGWSCRVPRVKISLYDLVSQLSWVPLVDAS